jgi:uncharacterized protein YoxC
MFRQILESIEAVGLQASLGDVPDAVADLENDVRGAANELSNRTGRHTQRGSVGRSCGASGGVSVAQKRRERT